MAPSSQEVVDEIRRIARQELELQRPVDAGDELIRDLQLDSLGLTILAVGLEDRFRIKLTEDGPVLQMESVRLQLKASEAVEIESKRVEIRASETVQIASKDEVKVDAEGDVRVNGKTIWLN